MVFLNDIPHLKIYRTKTYLPRDPKKQNFGSMVILNNPTVEDNIKFMDHPKMINGSKYLRYYMDARYQEKIGVKKIVRNKLRYRSDIYSTVSSSSIVSVTPLRFEQLKNRNFFYDLLVYNDLYFSYQKKYLGMRDRIENYFNFISRRIHDPKFNSYGNKILVMDLDAWEKYADYINSPVMYLFLSFRKWFDIFQSLGDIDIILYTQETMMRINPSKCNPNDFTTFRMVLSRVYKTSQLEDDYLNTLISQSELSDSLKNDLEGIFNFVGDDEEFKKELEKQIDDVTKDIDVDKELSKKVQNLIDDKVVSEPQPTKTDRTKSTADKGSIKSNISETEEDDIGDFDEDIEPLIAEDELEDINLDDIEEFAMDELSTDLSSEIAKNEELVKATTKLMQEKTVSKSSASMKRDEEIRNRQREVKFKNMTFDDLEKYSRTHRPIPETKIDSKIKTVNKNVTTRKFVNFDKEYNQELSKIDTMNILKNLNNMTIPTYVIDIKVEDSSDELNLKETYRITLEDEHRVRHSLTVDMPILLEDKFLYLNGVKKTINKQLMMKPISKTAPDQVQIVSNYNKIFLFRYGQKLTSEIETFKKVLAQDGTGVKYTMGDNRQTNARYHTSIEYDELSGSYAEIVKGRIEIVFNQQIIEKRLENTSIPKDHYCIGFDGNVPIFCNYKTGEIDGVNFINKLTSLLGKEFEDKYKVTTPGGTKFVYTRAKLMNKFIPIIIMLSYLEGIETVLKKAHIKYRLEDDKKSYNPEKEGMVKFSDGYLIYDKYPIENQLLLNGLGIIPTKTMSFYDMNERDIYLDIFELLYGTRALASYLLTFYEWMIDPITKEVLEDLDYPSDFVSVVLVANTLLGDNTYIQENNMDLYRIRSNEIINGILHEKLAQAYSTYRQTSVNKNPIKISMPKDTVIKELMTNITTVETHSTINPIYEAEKLRAISPKGHKGLNMDRAYTQDKRSYDETMVGIVGMSTSPDYNVGVMRQLTMEPNILSARGYMGTSVDPKDLKDVNIFTPAEMLTPMGVRHDDSIRTAMSSKQSKHILPVKNASPVLITNGAEKSIQYDLSSDWIITAEDDGEVVEVNEKNNLVVIQYKNGKCRAIDTSSKVVKNSQSGMYLTNQLKTDLKLGSKIKAGDIVAYEGQFFSSSKIEGNRFNVGTFVKVAVTSAYSTLEDSAPITQKLAGEMATEMVNMNDAIIGPNAELIKMAKIGDKVEVGDVLTSFSLSYEDDTYNKLLAGLSTDIAEEMESLNRVPVKATHAGVIKDIKVYCTVELEELSPTMRSFVEGYYDRINKKKRILNKYDRGNSVIKAGILFDEPTGRMKPTQDGNIKGRKVFDGVLVEFYIEKNVPLGVGDKLIFFGALKSICGEVIPKGEEPYALSEPGEEISAILGPSAVLARKVSSVIPTILGNKILVELKKGIGKIYND